jgi:hypothetical protein
MEQHALKNVNNCLNTNIYSYLETSGGQSSNLHFNVVHFYNTCVKLDICGNLRQRTVLLLDTAHTWGGQWANTLGYYENL